jgi:hypothetical protein
LTWLQHDGSPRDALLIVPALAVVTPHKFYLANDGDDGAVEEVAILLFATFRNPHDVEWLTRMPSATLALLREWLQLAAAKGSRLSAQWLEEIEAVAPPAGKPVGSPAAPPDDPRLDADTPTYRAYSRRFDEEVGADSLIPAGEQGRHRDMLERTVWTMLGAQNVTFAGDANLQGTLVAILLDCSGSLRGKAVERVAVLAAVIGDAVCRAGGTLELLGFTTAAWKGGRSRVKWAADGSPPNPGRLNDLRHVVFKSWDQSWESTADRLGLLLREGLLKENIDGEALAWAYRRALSVPALRRLILVVTDGAPLDDSTLSENHDDYLTDHLREVIAAIEEAGQVQLSALGVDHEPGGFYRHSAVWAAEAGRDGLALAWRLITECLRETQHQARGNAPDS